MKTLLFGFGVLALVGCNTTALKPTGPLAKEVPITQQGRPIAPADTGPPPAIRPTPTALVKPGDTNAANATAVAESLGAELKADGNPTKGPVTVEVSRIKGGTK